jgi:epoxide hydrolase-like predicted phosphatase
MVKAIAFDVGGVLQLDRCPELSRISTSRIKKGQKCYGVHETIAKHLKIGIDTWFDAIDTTYAGAITGRISYKKTIKKIADNLNIPASKLKKVLVKSYKHDFIRNNVLYDIVKKLKRNGYKTMILSDQWPPSEEALIPKSDKKQFNLSIISCDVGLRKPDQRIYKLALKRARVQPHEVVFIDNREWNTKPAEKLGIKTILFKNNKQAIKELNKMGVNTR